MRARRVFVLIVLASLPAGLAQAGSPAVSTQIRLDDADGFAAVLDTWSTACPDWQRRIVAGETLIPPIPLNEARAAKGLRIFKRLRMVDVIGQPTMGEACGHWVFDLVRTVLGAYNAELRRQLIRELLLFVAKKNGKSAAPKGATKTAPGAETDAAAKGAATETKSTEAKQ